MVADVPVRIFDTTLRDGEQAPGAGLTVAEKLEVARQLVRLNVDVIEAGFPASSPGDFEAVERIAKETRGVAIAGLARCRDGDPQRAVDALISAERPQLHVFISTSDIHLQNQLRMDREQESGWEFVKVWRGIVAGAPAVPERDTALRAQLRKISSGTILAYKDFVFVPDDEGWCDVLLDAKSP